MTRLAVGDGHELYFEVSGNPEGIPVLCLHGGPGAGSDPGDRDVFDPATHRIVLLDQRGCGRSRPFGSIEANTTWHLVADIEVLRAHLQVAQWTLLGGSWGTTLALVYAQTHPDRVRAMLLRGVFLLRPEELAWFYRDGASRFLPEAWADFTSSPPDEVAWARWEATACSFRPDPGIIAYLTEPARSHALARIEAHYFAHGAWLAGRQLLANIDRIRHIPTILVHGRYDLVCPLKSAWDLHRAWPESELRIVEGAGHIAQDMTASLVAAARALSARLVPARPVERQERAYHS